MSNGTTHKWSAALAIGTMVRHHEMKQNLNTPLPFASALLGVALTNMPDLLEPATHPGHRQFFHSVTFAAMLGMGMKKLYDWKPEEDAHKAIRHILLVGGGAYLIHLALDACTPKSLPLIGRLG